MLLLLYGYNVLVVLPRCWREITDGGATSKQGRSEKGANERENKSRFYCTVQQKRGWSCLEKKRAYEKGISEEAVAPYVLLETPLSP